MYSLGSIQKLIRSCSGSLAVAAVSEHGALHKE